MGTCSRERGPRVDRCFLLANRFSRRDDKNKVTKSRKREKACGLRLTDCRERCFLYATMERCYAKGRPSHTHPKTRTHFPQIMFLFKIEKEEGGGSARREGTDVDHLGLVHLNLLADVRLERRPGEGHHAAPGGLEHAERAEEHDEIVDPRRLGAEFDDAGVCRDVAHLAAKVLGEVGDGGEMLVFLSQGLARGEVHRVEGFRLGVGRGVLRRLAGQFLPVVCEQLVEVFGSEETDLGEQELALDDLGVGVVEDGPDRDQVLQLPTGLFDDAVLSPEDDRHPREILHLGVAHHERVDVEAPRREDAGDAGQHARFVLHQTVEDVAHGGLARGGRGVV